MLSLKSRLQAQRSKLGQLYVDLRLKDKHVSLVSDDCWAGKVYQELGLKCLSPFVGMGVRSAQYLNFLTHMKEPGALDPISVSSEERGYPIIKTRHGDLMGMHYKSEHEFMQRYERRRQLINWENLFIKIDLGKPTCPADNIRRWNEMKLPHSIAFHPDKPAFHRANIHNGVCIPDWVDDGDRMFYRSCCQFDLIEWLNTGNVRFSRVAQWAHYFLHGHRNTR